MIKQFHKLSPSHHHQQLINCLITILFMGYYHNPPVITMKNRCYFFHQKNGACFSHRWPLGISIDLPIGVSPIMIGVYRSVSFFSTVYRSVLVYLYCVSIPMIFPFLWSPSSPIKSPFLLVVYFEIVSGTQSYPVPLPQWGARSAAPSASSSPRDHPADALGKSSPGRLWPLRHRESSGHGRAVKIQGLIPLITGVK